MTFLLVVVGAILGAAFISGFGGGALIGAVLGLFAAWGLKLGRRLDAAEKQLTATRERLGRIDKALAEADRQEVAVKEQQPGTESRPPEAQPLAAKAMTAAAKTVRETPAEPEVPPPTPIPAKPAMPPAAAIPSSDAASPVSKAQHDPIFRPKRAAQTSHEKIFKRKSVPKSAPPRTRAPELSWLADFLQRWVLGGNPLVKVGVVILFLGLAFALRYAAELGLLPLWLRYAAVAATGISLIALGWRWRHREDNYGLVLQGAGIGVLYLTTLAAMKLHPLLPVSVGFVLLFLIAAFAAFRAVVDDSMLLAVVATLGGFAAPVLASTGAGNHIILFSYLTVLNLGIVAIAWFRRWRVLNIIGYVCSFGLGGAWAAKHYRDELFWSTEPFLLLLFVCYVLITVLFARRTLTDADDNDASTLGEHVRRMPNEIRYVDGSLAFGVPISAFWVQHLLVAPYQYGTAISAIGFSLFYFALAFVMTRNAGKRYLLLNETLIALGAIFGTLAIPLLETQWTAAAWAIEAAGVYWIGYRQRQLHVRLFSFLVLIGSAIYFVPELRLSSSGPVLDGPILAAILLAASAAFTYRLMWRAEPGCLHDIETGFRPVLVVFGAAILATIPLLVLPRDWSGPGLAMLGTAVIYLSMRLRDRTVLGAGWFYQLAGGSIFLGTLELAGSGAVLANGWPGLLATCLIGMAMIAGTAVVAPGLFKSGADDKTSELEMPVSAALLAGLAFINLAPLFVLSWRMSAMTWPVIGIATLIWALRTRHTGLIFFSVVLQAIAGYAHLHSRLLIEAVPVSTGEATAFANSAFIGPLVISLAGFACARLMHRGARGRGVDDSLGWLAIAWGGLWWAFGWTAEVTRVVTPSGVSALLIAVTLITGWTGSLVAQRLKWPQLGAAVLVYLPVLVVIGARDVLGGTLHPGAGWGVLAWPAAFIVHFLLLRRQKIARSSQLLGYFHAAGALFFIALASVEAHWWLERWSRPATVWPWLAGMLVPAAYVWAVSRNKVQQSWPVREFTNSYVMVTALPLVFCLIGWLWLTNAINPGDASPLPYVAVLNPLELAYVAILAAIFPWWQFIRRHAELQRLDVGVNSALAATAFAAITGGVIRACHHWANIEWDRHALYASDTVQASLSIVWGTLAISLMLFGNRRQLRTVWFGGAFLVGVVVLKLFVIELSAVDTMQRIVSFIVVGLLLLLVGYVAPLPPRGKTERPNREDDKPAVTPS